MFYVLLILLAFCIDTACIHTEYDIPGLSVFVLQIIFLYALWLRKRSKFSQNNSLITPDNDTHSETKKSLSIPILVVLTIVLSIWFSIFSNPLFTWIFLFLLIFVDVILISLIYAPGLIFGIYSYKDCSFLYFIVTTVFSRSNTTLSGIKQELYKYNHIKEYGPTILRALYGLIILMCVIVPLLLSSDIIFQKILGDIFSTLFSGLDIFGIIIRMIVIIFIFWILVTIFLSLENTQYHEADMHIPSLKIHKIYNYIILGGINCIYLIFVIIQFRYTWFVDASNFSNLGISYGEYIHSGFYQLIAIAIINYCIYLFFYKKTHTKGENGIKANLYILLICTLLINYSALSRILLYIEVYHMTVLRFFVVYIILCIMVLSFLTLCNLYKENKKYTGIFINMVLMSFIILGYSNVEKFVVNYNIAHSQSDYSDLDINYILGLSHDVVLEKIDLVEKTKGSMSYIPIDPLYSLSQKNMTSLFHYNYYRNKFLDHISPEK